MATIGALVYKIGLDLSQLVENTRQTQQQLDKLGQAADRSGQMAARAGQVLRSAFTATAILGVVKSAIDAGDAIGDLAAKAGVSASAFQRLSESLGPAGVSAEQTTQALVMMSDRLVSGDKSAVRALERLGLSVADLKAQSPDQVFLTVGEAIAGVEDPMQRASLAMDVFGKSGAQLVGGLTTDLKAVAASQAVMSDETVDAMSRVSDAFSNLWRDGKRLVAELLAPLAPLVSGLAWVFAKFADGVGWVVSNVKGLFGPLGYLKEVITQVTEGWQIMRGTVAAPLAPAVKALPVGQALAALGVPEDLDAIITQSNQAIAVGAQAAEARLRAVAQAQEAARRAAEAHARELDKLTGMDKVQGLRQLAAHIAEIWTANQSLDPTQLDAIWQQFEAGIAAARRLGQQVPQAWIDIQMAIQAARIAQAGFWADQAKLTDAAKDLPGHGVDGPGLVPKDAPTFVPPAAASGWIDLAVVAEKWKTFTETIQKTLGDMIVGLKTWKDGLRSLWQSALSMVSQLISGMLQGLMERLQTWMANTKAGAAVAMGVAGIGGYQAGRQQGVAAGLFSGGLGGMATGMQFGAMFGPPGAMVGAIVGGIGGALSGLFGAFSRPSESQRANSQVNQYLSQFQGDAFNQQFRDAQVNSDVAGQLTRNLFNAKTTAEATAAQQAITDILARNNGLLQEQRGIQSELTTLEAERVRLTDALKVSWSDVTAIAERYGLNLEGLGVGINQLGTTTNFTQIINDLEALNRAAQAAGAELDWGGALVGMKDEINQLVQQAMRMGTAIPENMRPFIEELLRSGQLLDATGQQMTDLEGIQWGAAVETEQQRVNRQLDLLNQTFDRMTSRLEEIITLLASGLGNAAATGAQLVEGAINGIKPNPIRIPVEVDGVGDGFPGMATGGVVTRPTLTWIGERGPEAVIPLSQAARYGVGGGAGGPQTIVVPVDIDGERVTEVVLRRVPGQLAWVGA